MGPYGLASAPLQVEFAFPDALVSWVARQHPDALAETVNGLYKAELIRRQGPWRTTDQVEVATAASVEWWNQRRLHSACRHVPPAEYEAMYYRERGAAHTAA
jgi:putative transposase